MAGAMVSVLVSCGHNGRSCLRSSLQWCCCCWPLLTIMSSSSRLFCRRKVTNTSIILLFTKNKFKHILFWQARHIRHPEPGLHGQSGLLGQGWRWKRSWLHRTRIAATDGSTGSGDSGGRGGGGSGGGGGGVGTDGTNKKLITFKIIYKE